MGPNGRIAANKLVLITRQEVPHQVADLSMLRASGFSKSQAIGAQLATGLCAFAGTMLGIWAHRSSVAGATEVETDLVASLLGSQLLSRRRDVWSHGRNELTPRCSRSCSVDWHLGYLGHGR